MPESAAVQHSRSDRPVCRRATSTTDTQLVEAARDGSQEAFTALHDRHLGAARLAVRDRAGDRSAVDDIVQEAFARAFERLGNLREPSDFRPWLLQIARHAAVDYRRRSRPSVSFDSETIETPAAADNVENEYEGRAIEQQLLEIISQLPAREASVLRSIRNAGQPDYEHLAVLVGTTPDNARSIVHRARRRLKGQLDAYWDTIN